MNKLTIMIVQRNDLKSSSDTHWLGLKAYVNTQKVLLSLGISCPSANWDDNKQRVVYISGGTIKRELINQWNDLIIRATDRANDINQVGRFLLWRPYAARTTDAFAGP